MITFLISLAALVLGYLVYGRFVERIFVPDDRVTPAVAQADGLDYVAMPYWKVFMIQFLNIAGTGPIFGAIMGAKFGPAAYLWIIFGCIFAGAVHDYFVGMLSMRNGGCDLPELVRRYLGGAASKVLLVFAVFLLIMLGTVFVYSPAEILHGISGSTTMWITIIFIYYVVATMLPIDKIIGKAAVPASFTDNIFPCLFITIACGAISGFHATQSPLMARCLTSERKGRPIFYGAMITEGLVALVWATVSMWFFYDAPQPGYAQIGGTMANGLHTSAPVVVNLVCKDWLGIVGGVLAMLGVVAAPITSGDTAFRSARLIIAQALKLSQRAKKNRLYICVPLFAASFAMLVWQMENPDGFNTIWQYFGWANQTLSVFALWTITVYLVRERKPYVITLVPALFMTCVCTTFFMVSKTALGLPYTVGYGVGATALVVAAVWFVVWMKKSNCKG